LAHYNDQGGYRSRATGLDEGPRAGGKTLEEGDLVCDDCSCASILTAILIIYIGWERGRGRRAGDSSVVLRDSVRKRRIRSQRLLAASKAIFIRALEPLGVAVVPLGALGVELARKGEMGCHWPAGDRGEARASFSPGGSRYEIANKSMLSIEGTGGEAQGQWRAGAGRQHSTTRTTMPVRHRSGRAQHRSASATHPGVETDHSFITAFERSPEGGKGLARIIRASRWALEEVGPTRRGSHGFVRE